MRDMIALVEPLIPALRRYARSLLRDRASADDLVQDCLERALSRWHQRQPEGDARSWIFAILHNLAMNRLKQTARRGAHLPLDAVGEEAFAHAATQENALLNRDLLGALADLPEDQRSVLLLVSVEDLSYAEVARVLDIPIGTVMSRLSRAREKLLKAIEPDAAASERGSHLRRVK
jgi:RNA polymerase sigma-70 factor (ECF subfamily)